MNKTVQIHYGVHFGIPLSKELKCTYHTELLNVGMDTFRSHKHWRNLLEKGTECTKITSTPKYKYQKRTIQQQLKSAYWNYVNEIVTSTDGSLQKPSYAKKCWTYMKHCRTDHTRVSPLTQNGILHSNPKAKAETLNQQFSRSFITDDQSPQETNLYNLTLPKMPDIEITETVILKHLGNIKPYKAHGPDNTHPRILRVSCWNCAIT